MENPWRLVTLAHLYGCFTRIWIIFFGLGVDPKCIQASLLSWLQSSQLKFYFYTPRLFLLQNKNIQKTSWAEVLYDILRAVHDCAFIVLNNIFEHDESSLECEPLKNILLQAQLIECKFFYLEFNKSWINCYSLGLLCLLYFLWCTSAEVNMGIQIRIIWL